MTKGRRDVKVADTERWVFNRMAAAYSARPPYPAALIDAIAELALVGATPAQSRVLDIGAGIGHLALPLAARGFDVTAVEPAMAMLTELRRASSDRGLPIRLVAAAAESLPLEEGAVDVAIVADALHFLNPEVAPREIARVLNARGWLVVVTSEPSDTPFMRGVASIMTEASQRRPRRVASTIEQTFSMVGARATLVRQFRDETPVDAELLETILRSVSFIGPAMNSERFEAFRRRIHALEEAPVWARTLTLHAGRRKAPR
jgi:ubiquinone/menaquinone biosynthesis C-methylase UbiE